jgi:DNA-binding NtrC family response regulator
VLFGRPGVRGAAPGKVAAAHGGTLLLKEIGELPPAAQRGLLDLLETGELPRADGSRRQRVNFRLVATSSRRLLNLARSGEIDAALYNRLNVLPLYLPPLRDRRAELAPLAGRFLATLSAEAGRHVAGIAPAALALLAAYDWPGNVRELENAIWRAIALARSPMLEPADFPQLLASVVGRDAAAAGIGSLAPASAPVHIDRAMAPLKQLEGTGRAPDRFLTPAGEISPLADLERELIAFALEKYRGRMSAMARALGIGRSTLYRKLRDYGLDAALESDAA